MFKNNISPRDRVYRASASAILISAFFSAPDWSMKWVALFVGLYLLFTAVTSTCAIYSVFRRSTKDEAEPEADATAKA